ncbi:MAG: PIG-L family deacetylase [Acidobacteriota bacterium]
MIEAGGDDALRLPPGVVTEVKAKKALVLAPHQDDEVLGCGGVIAEVVGAGGEVEVIFLTDGSGGVEEIADREAYAQRRRQESAEVADLMGFHAVSWEFPDGALAHHGEELEEKLAAALQSFEPDLLLVISPLEVTSDHRATFAALHRLLGRQRPGHGLAELLRETAIWVYEINHPLDPEILVDAGAHLPLLEQAMGIYDSQQERHDYWRAGLALRRYRTLSLGPEIEAAEAFVALTLEDFTTRSPSGLIRRLGGVPERLELREGPSISVIVRTLDRPEMLAEALDSLDTGLYRRVEIVLVNDGGEPPKVPESLGLEVVEVNLERNRGRAGAANAGIEAATGEVIAFLDDDDLAYPEHFATLARALSALEVKVAYVDAAVCVYELDGKTGRRPAERRLPYSRDFDRHRLLLDNYIPFHTVALRREALADLERIEGQVFDESLPFFEDWDFLLRLSREVPFHHVPAVTCEYRHFRSAGHHVFGESPRQRADFLEVKGRVLARHLGLPEADSAALEEVLGLATAIDGLRAETVAAQEAEEKQRKARRRLEHQVSDQEGKYHALNGRAVALEGDLSTVSAAHQEAQQALHQLQEDFQRVDAVAAERDRVLQRAFEDNERLGAAHGELQARVAELHLTVGQQDSELQRQREAREAVQQRLHDLESRWAVKWLRRLWKIFGRAF